MRLFRLTLPVTDIEAATRFYAQVLGQPGRRVSAGRHYFDVGRSILACLDARAEGDGGFPGPLPDHVYLAVHDLETFLARAEAAGASFDLAVSEDHGVPGRIEDRPWGERSFYCRDPFGNRLAFVESGTEFTGD